MYLVALKVNRKRPLKIVFRFDDPSISKPLLPLTVGYYTVMYGTSIGAMIILLILELVMATHVHRLYFKYLFGWLVNCNINVFVKMFVGRPRPNFLAMNRWRGTPVACNGFSDEKSLPEPKTELEKLLSSESGKSFFSAHAVLGTYAGSFIAIYLWSEFARTPLTLVACLVAILAGMYPGLTQWKNYWHHWDDVAFGYLIAFTTSYMCYFYL